MRQRRRNSIKSSLHPSVNAQHPIDCLRRKRISTISAPVSSQVGMKDQGFQYVAIKIKLIDDLIKKYKKYTFTLKY